MCSSDQVATTHGKMLVALFVLCTASYAVDWHTLFHVALSLK